MAEEQEFSEKELNAVLDRLIQGKTPEDILGQTDLVKDSWSGWTSVAHVVRRGRIDGKQLRLGRPARGCDRRRMLRDAQVPKHRADDGGVGQKCQDAHLTVAGGAAQRVDLIDASQQLCPAPPRSAVAVPVGARRGVRFGGGQRIRPAQRVGPALPPVPDHLPPPARIRREDAVIPVAMHPGWRDQTGQALEQRRGSETDRGAAVPGDARKVVVQPRVRRGE